MHHEYHSFLFDEFPYISHDSLEKSPPLKNIIANIFCSYEVR